MVHSIQYKIHWMPGKFLFNFNDTISREEHKTIYSGLRITGMALPIKLPVFFSPRKVNLTVAINSSFDKPKSFIPGK